MILGDAEIRRLIWYEHLVDVHDMDLIQPASLDIRLGNQFKPQEQGTTETSEKFMMRPGDVVQVCTLEIFRMPRECAGEVKLKSSMSRKGLNLANGCWVDPGYIGALSLTLINNNPDPFYLHYCMPFAQLIIYEVKGCTHRYSGKYQGSQKLQSAKEDYSAHIK